MRVVILLYWGHTNIRCFTLERRYFGCIKRLMWTTVVHNIYGACVGWEDEGANVLKLIDVYRVHLIKYIYTCSKINSSADFEKDLIKNSVFTNLIKKTNRNTLKCQNSVYTLKAPPHTHHTDICYDNRSTRLTNLVLLLLWW